MFKSILTFQQATYHRKYVLLNKMLQLNSSFYRYHCLTFFLQHILSGVIVCLVAMLMLGTNEWTASSTYYDGTDQTSCGGCPPNVALDIPGWASAATPESMQLNYCPGLGDQFVCGTGKW